MLQASVVIPVYNEATELQKVLDALENQTFPRDKFEVIVVDNGSTDNTEELVRGYEKVKYLLQVEYLNSSYSSRNRGIEASKGEVIILLDGTVIPEKKWLEEGLNCMKKKNADIVTSNVRFDFGGKVTGGKLYDSNNATTRSQVKQRGVAVTASLFVQADLFKELGKFAEGTKTAEDGIWTWRATQRGYRLEFCGNSRAIKKAKSFGKLLKKQWREAKGYPVFWRLQGKHVPLYKKLIKSLLPYHPKKLDRLVKNVDFEVKLLHKIRLYFVAWTIWVTMSLGHIYGSYLLNKEDAEENRRVKELV
ncbi:glycosyltransferase [Fodinibius saliphilus]|uniref:glycosyltransferase n=1 Tax=Fodinibius saliphilus TaxID=1920650 RepID=UPI001109E271|nr:glycosyltransferase [Fodinibius saliphilus]